MCMTGTNKGFTDTLDRVKARMAPPECMACLRLKDRDSSGAQAAAIGKQHCALSIPRCTAEVHKGAQGARACVRTLVHGWWCARCMVHTCLARVSKFAA